MSLRDFLLDQGVSAKDLAQAVEDSRDVVRGAARWAGVTHSLLKKVEERPNLGKKVKACVVLGSKLAAVVEAGAKDMLSKRTP